MQPEDQLPPPEKVRVLQAVLDRQSQYMLWLVELENGDRYPMEWRRSDIKVSFKLKHDPTDEEIDTFLCNKMIGREINLIIIRDKDENVPN